MQWWDILSVVLAFLAIVWLVRMVASGNARRHEEDDARAFFDRHGRWPDEDAPGA